MYLLKRALSVDLHLATAIESTQYEPGHSESTNPGPREGRGTLTLNTHTSIYAK